MWLSLTDGRKTNTKERSPSMMWGFGWLGFVWMALFWVGVILLVAWAIRRPDDDTRRSGNRAMDILEERFALGEVNADEFEARRRERAR